MQARANQHPKPPPRCYQLRRNRKEQSIWLPRNSPSTLRQDDTPQSFSKNFDQTGNSSGFIFDVTLSTAIAANGKVEAQAPVPKGPLSPEMLDKMNRYWRAANYLCIGQIYLFENPLLREPLKA